MALACGNDLYSKYVYEVSQFVGSNLMHERLTIRGVYFHDLCYLPKVSTMLHPSPFAKPRESCMHVKTLWSVHASRAIWYVYIVEIHRTVPFVRSSGHVFVCFSALTPYLPLPTGTLICLAPVQSSVDEVNGSFEWIWTKQTCILIWQVCVVCKPY